MPCPNLHIETSDSGDVTVVRLAGSADMAQAENLNRCLDEAFARRRYRLAIDLARLDFTASSGLGSLIRAHKRCRDHQGRLNIVAPQPAVLDVLHKTRLDMLFNIYKTLAEAVDDLQAR